MANHTLAQLANPNALKDRNNLLSRNGLSRFYENWPWFVLSVFLSMVTALAFLRYKTPEYKINASILVKDDTKGSDFGEAIVLQGLGLTSGKSNVDNEVEVLKSRTLAESVVKDLQVYVQYFSKGKVKTTEIYTDAPFLLRFVNEPQLEPKREQENYMVSVGKHFEFTLTNQGKKYTGKFRDTISLPLGKVILTKTTYPVIEGNTYSIRIGRLDQTVKQYRKALSIAATNKMVSMINLVLTDLLPERGELILSRHIANYLINSINDKNRVADSTVAFIDANLRLVTDELVVIEKEIEKFRRANHLADMEESGRILLQSSDQVSKEQTENAVHLKVIELLQAHLRENAQQIIPASLIIDEANFTELISKYNQLQLTRGTELMNRTSDHPVVKNLDGQLHSLKENIESSIAAKKAALQIQIAQLTRHQSASESQLDLIPGKQRIFLDYSRQQQIKQELYLFLLKKRVETSLSKSSTIANGRIIDNPRADIFPFRPNRQLTLLVALLIGLCLPALFIYTKEMLSDTIGERIDIEEYVPAPIIAEIGHKSPKQIGVLSQNAPRYLAEQFRVLRTNLQLSMGAGEQVILVTSGKGGEGKSFVAVNLAATISLIRKRVVLVEFDFRKPKIASYLNLRNKGITDYVISDRPLEEFVQTSHEGAGFDVLVCGSIPHNPAELILLPKIEEMMKQLRSQYEYILMDTAPIGMVTDAQLLSRYADITLYIVRRKFTIKSHLNQVKELYYNNRLPRLNVVFNEVKASTGGDYSNYMDAGPDPFLKRLFSRFF